MKRVILSIPEGLTLDQLTPEQQDAIASVFAQFVLPMPGTIAANTRVLCDGVTADNFDPLAIGELGLPFELIGMWQWNGSGDQVTLLPLDEAAFLPFLPDVVSYDEAGVEVSRVPAAMHIPHRWAGWPDCLPV